MTHLALPPLLAVAEKGTEEAAVQVVQYCYQHMFIELKRRGKL